MVKVTIAGSGHWSLLQAILTGGGQSAWLQAPGLAPGHSVAGQPPVPPVSAQGTPPGHLCEGPESERDRSLPGEQSQEQPLSDEGIPQCSIKSCSHLFFNIFRPEALKERLGGWGLHGITQPLGRSPFPLYQSSPPSVLGCNLTMNPFLCPESCSPGHHSGGYFSDHHGCSRHE